MNHQTFQKAFNHFMSLAQESDSVEDHLFTEVFRTLVEERSLHLNLYRRLETMISEASVMQRDLRGTVASREQMLSEQALEAMGLRQRIQTLEHELEGYKAREEALQALEQASRISSTNEAARVELLEQQVGVLKDDLDRERQQAKQVEDDLRRKHKLLEHELGSTNDDLALLEDDKAVLAQKLADAQQRILELLNQPAPRPPGRRFPNGE